MQNENIAKRRQDVFSVMTVLVHNVEDTSVDQMGRIVRSDINLLVTGETVLGRAFMAEWAHNISKRSDGPFVRMTCAEEMSREFFDKKLMAAAGGTLFLSQIQDLPDPLAGRLLTVMNDMEGEPGQGPAVRVVAAGDEKTATTATQREIFTGLAPALKILPVEQWKANARLELAKAFLTQAAEAEGYGAAPELTENSAEKIKKYSWPGGLQEMKNVMHMAVLRTGPDGGIAPENLILDDIQPEGQESLAAPLQQKKTPKEMQRKPLLLDEPSKEDPSLTLADVGQSLAQLLSDLAERGERIRPSDAIHDIKIHTRNCALERSRHVVGKAAALIGADRNTFSNNRHPSFKHPGLENLSDIGARLMTAVEELSISGIKVDFNKVISDVKRHACYYAWKLASENQTEAAKRMGIHRNMLDNNMDASLNYE